MPEQQAVALPTDRFDTQPYLKSYGLEPVSPYIRSSDWRIISTEGPFQYYLVRRLGILPKISQARALDCGTYFHWLVEHAQELGPMLKAEYTVVVDQKCKQITEIARGMGKKTEQVQEIIENERRNANDAYGWYGAACVVPIDRTQTKQRPTTLVDFAHRDGWVTLGTEVLLRNWFLDDAVDWPALVEIDLLKYHPERHLIDIDDIKTTGDPATYRLSLCPAEFQTLLYMNVVNELLISGELQDMFDLHPDTRLNQMNHLCFQKPSIRMSGEDCDYQWISEGKKTKTSGSITRHPDNTPDKYMARWTYQPDQTSDSFSGTEEECVEALHAATGKKPEKKPLSEPKHENFIRRCGQYFRCEGAYRGNEQEFKDSPPINISHTKASMINHPWRKQEFLSIMSSIAHFAKCDPEPGNFPRADASFLLKWKKMSKYFPFVVNEAKDWPEIIRTNGFTIEHRNAPVVT